MSYGDQYEPQDEVPRRRSGPPQPPVQQHVYVQPPQYAGPSYVQPPQYAGPARAVAKTRKRTSHGLHLVLTIFTGGLWGICVWLPLTAWHKWGPRQKTVTRYR